ncbi:hypothetical protein E8E11_010836 [Didymella keratinophila]|nr:hypothetical protein E8E11_010836 [Didymella keratinophila]
MSDETPAERVSRFREHTNTNSSIRPPPSELWKDVGIEALLDKFNDEDASTPAVRRPNHPRRIMEPTGHRKSPSNAAKAAAAARAAGSGPNPRKQSDAAATVATAEGTFGRFSRVFANVFGGVLGKRKHDSTPFEGDAAQAALDERKRAAEEAYHLAKAQGLLPAPKVFVRPGMAPRAWSADGPASRASEAAESGVYGTATPLVRADGTPRPRPTLTPRTPGSVARSPSKRDLNKQRKLSKRVSSLEVKLASAKKELQSVLGNECFPAVPPLPGHISTGLGDALSPTPNAGYAALPNTPHVFSSDAPLSPSFGEDAKASLPGKITKKRKSVVHDDDTEFLPTATATASDVEVSEAEAGRSDAEPILSDEDITSPVPARQNSLKRAKRDASKRLKRTSSRLQRKVSRSSVREEKEERVVVVKPGGAVPPVPVVPRDVEGRKVKVVGDDGYGGLGHEIF